MRILRLRLRRAQDDSTKDDMAMQSTERTPACHSEHPVRGVEESVFSWGDADPSTALRALRMTIQNLGRFGDGSFGCAARAQDDSTKYGTPVERTVEDAGPYMAYPKVGTFWGRILRLRCARSG